jgi:molybdopterin-dependent oxidoreductase alpha subunit
MTKRKVAILPPEKFENLKYTGQKNKAAGLKAVKVSLDHVAEELGLLKGMKLLAKMNQKDGFDCPGCAWPDPDEERSKLGEYCENGAKAIAEEGTNKRITADFFKNNSVEKLSLESDFVIGKFGRLTEPMFLANNSSHYQPISWGEAFQKIGNKLKSLSSPDEAAFYTSGRTSNEAAYLYQLFVRQYGTNNLPDCSNMCHESSGAGLSKTVGIGKGSVTLQDIYEAEVVVVMGQNPGTNHPRMLSALEKCKDNGGKIVTVNPLHEAGTNTFVDPQSVSSVLKGGVKLEDLFLQVKINGDVALLNAVMILMLEEEEKKPGSVFDLDFIKNQTAGYDELIQHLKSSDFNEAVKSSGVIEKDVRSFADLLIHNKKIIICWAMGITQHKNGVENVQEIVNVLLLKGSIGKPGAGTCPVRGHSNVQGDRTMGIWEKPAEQFLAKLDEVFEFKAPREHGLDAVEAIHAMAVSKLKVFIGLGGNFISATPDSKITGEAMQNCDLTVQISTKLNRGHLVTGKEALILPCISRSEEDIQKSGQQFVTVENSMGVVHMSKGTLEPASNKLKSEPAIVAGIAAATLNVAKPNWNELSNDYDLIRDYIEATISGFDDYNKRVRNPSGFYLPNGARDGEFNTANGKANFTVNEIPNRAISANNFIMMTIRTHDQYNTTIYGLNDRYRGVENERRVVLMNKEDLKSQGLKPEQIVNLKSHFKGEVRQANNFKVLEYDIPVGCVATYFPETNVLVPLNNVAKVSNTPASKFIEVSVEKV